MRRANRTKVLALELTTVNQLEKHDFLNKQQGKQKCFPCCFMQCVDFYAYFSMVNYDNLS